MVPWLRRSACRWTARVAQAHDLGPGLRENMSAYSHLTLLHVLLSPLDLLLLPVYSAPVVELKGVTSPLDVLSHKMGERPCYSSASRCPHVGAQCWVGLHCPSQSGLGPHDVTLPRRMGLDSRTSRICPLSQTGPGMHRNNAHIHAAWGFAGEPT